MKALSCISVGLTAILSAGSCLAGSPYAGHEKAAAVCSQCHGIVAPSTDAPFPPLAGRDAEYLKSALKQYRDKSRVSEIMNAVAGSLSDNDIDNIVSYYSHVKN